MGQILKCLPLATLGRIIGFLGLVVSIVSVLLFSVMLYRLDALTHVMIEQTREPNQDTEHIRRVLLIVAIVYLMLSAMNLLTSLLLLVGISKEKPMLLLPWLTNAGIGLGTSIVYFFYFATTTLLSTLSIRHVPLSLQTAAISLLIQMLVWLSIYALYKRMKCCSSERQLIRATSKSPSYGNM